MGNHQSSSERNHQSSSSSALHRTRSPPEAPLNPHTVVDGGFLEPQSHIYVSALQEYHRPTVHKLIIDRKLAPFYLGLNDFEPEWELDEIVAALEEAEQQATRNVKEALAAAINAASEAEAVQQTTTPSSRKGKESAAAAALAVMHRERLAELSKIRDKEGGGGLQWTRKTEQAKLYQGQAIDCPICFLYYPPPLVHTRCCDQPICTECFVQIKRADPTTTHLESEPAACPFCMEINFGCLYIHEKPQPRPSIPTLPSTGSAASGTSGVSMEQAAAASPSVPKPRRKSFAHTEKQVVTTDQLHPDWEAKLEAIKATVARRANRRIVFRQVGDRLIPVGITSGREADGANPSMSTTSLPPGFAAQVAAALDAGSAGGSGRRAMRRRNQEMSNLLEQMGVGVGPDLEEMMVMEAMRLSMVEDEERQKKAAEEKAKAGQNGQATAGTSSSGPTSHVRDTLTTPHTPKTTANMLSEAISAPMGSVSLLDPSPGPHNIALPPMTPSHPLPRSLTPSQSPILSATSTGSSPRTGTGALGALSGGAIFAATGSPTASSSFPKQGESTEGNSLSRGLVGIGLVGAAPSRASDPSASPKLVKEDASNSAPPMPTSTSGSKAAAESGDSDDDEVPLTPSQGYQQLDDDEDDTAEGTSGKLSNSEERHEVTIPARNSSRSLVDAA